MSVTRFCFFIILRSRLNSPISGMIYWAKLTDKYTCIQRYILICYITVKILFKNSQHFILAKTSKFFSIINSVALQMMKIMEVTKRFSTLMEPQFKFLCSEYSRWDATLMNLYPVSSLHVLWLNSLLIIIFFCLFHAAKITTFRLFCYCTLLGTYQ
jgi:hypothetical protein